MMNKYDIFFASVKDIVLRLRLSEPEDLVGATNNEIALFEQNNNAKYPAVMHSFLRYFGKKAKVWERDSTFWITFPHLERVLSKVRNFTPTQNAWQLIDNNNFRVNYGYINEESGKTIEDYTPIKDIMSVEHISFLEYIEHVDCLSFFDYTVDNPRMYYIEAKEDVYSDIIFTNRFRILFYLAFALNAKTDFTYEGKYPPLTDFTGIEWLKDYIFIYKYLGIGRKILSYRNDFYEINDEREKRENRILTVGEFETEFLNYVRQQGHDF